MRSLNIIRALFFYFLCLNVLSISAQKISLRAPAYPLITIDPYTSAWSFSDELYNDDVRHWTGKPHTLTGALRVDGKVYRFMGKGELPMKTVVPMAAEEQWMAQYTFSKPEGDWMNLQYDASSWKSALAAFGTEGMPFLSTSWTAPDIWVRREITLTKDQINADLYLEYSHDDDFELYFNGVKIVDTGKAWNMNVRIPLPEAARKTIHGGRNIIAAHCFNSGGAAYVDFGLFEKSRAKNYFSETAKQQSLTISATQTNYQFDCGPVTLNLTFTSPLLPDDLELLSRPVGYIAYNIASKDDKTHTAEIYFDASPQWAVHTGEQPVELEKITSGNLTLLKTGTKEQNILGRKGDDVRIDWGYFYLAAESTVEKNFSLSDYGSRKAFAERGKLNSSPGGPSALLACVERFATIDKTPRGGKLMLGYDDLYSVQFFGKNLQAWWKENDKHNIADAFEKANTNYTFILERCEKFDQQLAADALKAGGEQYEDLCVLAYRQAIAAHKLVRGEHDELYFFSKENFSNGSIGTVDVTYPSAPLFLLYNPDLLKGMLNPIFYYSESGKWTKPFAAHDVGTYPLANGQTYNEDMPVEESGNMIILSAAIAVVEGKADYAKQHWDALTQWAAYLEKAGFDPENQLCTDDFAGHLAHNTNLSVKAIVALACYARLAHMLNLQEVETKYSALAKTMATQWAALAADGDHYDLAFRNKGTWSQKYNLVWDKLLDLQLFPPSVSLREVQFYLNHQNKYGLPLDSRKTYSKSDWIIWSATLSEDKLTFAKFITPLFDYVTQTPDRAPLSDWHETTNAKVVGFRARSVVGGYYIKILADKLRKKRLSGQ